MFILVVVVLIACSFESKLQEFISETGGFSIMAPSSLKEVTQSVNMAFGKTDLYIFSSNQGKKAYFVAYFDFPADFARQNGPQKLLDGGCERAVGNINGKLISDIKISLSGNPGRELVIDAKLANGEDRTLRERLFIVGDRLYNVTVVAPRGEINSSDIDFLKSLKLYSK